MIDADFKVETTCVLDDTEIIGKIQFTADMVEFTQYANIHLFVYYIQNVQFR